MPTPEDTKTNRSIVKIDAFLSKYVMYAVYVLAISSLMGSCNSCGVSKENAKMKRAIDSLNVQIVMLKDEMCKKKDFELTIRNLLIDIKIEGLKTSKRMLFDQNAIVRQVTRPDDRMNVYDAAIEELEKSRLK